MKGVESEGALLGWFPGREAIWAGPGRMNSVY